MHVCAVRLLLAGAGVGLLVAVPSAQRPLPQPGAAAGPVARTAPAPSIAGLWKFDEGDSKDDERNWRRPVRPDPSLMATGAGSGPMMTGALPGPSAPVFMRRPGPDARTDNAVRRALRDLLEAAESYRIEVTADHVTMTDDLGRTIAYATDGAREKHRLGATEFEAETNWYRAQLVQKISSGALSLSQVFLPSDDGQTMFLEIRVEKPDLKPPVKVVNRVYTRIDNR
jgi:hypothetical protein